MSVLAIDIGGTKLQLAEFCGAQMMRKTVKATNRAGGREAMLSQIEAALREWDVRWDAAGIGFGGPVDFSAQRVVHSTHVGGWGGFDLAGWVAARTGGRVTIDNDANVGALGEARHGAGVGLEPLFYMTLSTGIGGGIVLPGGAVLRGADSYAGEIGHVTIDPDGPECLCGARGCLERMCSGLWNEREQGRPMAELLTDEEFVARYVRDLALGLKTVVMVLNPARIVIGGGIAKAGEPLFGPLRAELGRTITAWSRARIDVVPAALGDDSVLWGCLELAKEE